MKRKEEIAPKIAEESVEGKQEEGKTEREKKRKDEKEKKKKAEKGSDSESDSEKSAPWGHSCPPSSSGRKQ